MSISRSPTCSTASMRRCGRALRPSRSTWSSSGGRTTRTSLAMAEHFRGTGSSSASSSTWTSVRPTAGASTTSCPSAEIVRAIDESWPLEPVDPAYRGEVAARYRYRDGEGEIGLISSVTQPFCHDCTRARLSAEGKLYTCLFASRGHDLRALAARRRRPTPSSTRRCAPSGRVRDDRYSELRSGERPRSTRPRSRCRTSAVSAGDRQLRGPRAAPCERVRGALPRRAAHRARPDVARVAGPGQGARAQGAGWRRRRSAARDAPEPCPEGTTARGISEIVLCDVSDNV